jgi:hypothetical protein
MSNDRRSGNRKPSRPPQKVPTAVWVAMLVVLGLAVVLVALSGKAFRSIPKVPSEPSAQPQVEPSPGTDDQVDQTSEVFPPVESPRHDVSISHWIEQLRNGSLSVRERREAARALARIGSDEALAALKAALDGSPDDLKAAIAESLGESPHAAARDWLMQWLQHSDPAVVIGAMRGLALLGDCHVARRGRTHWDILRYASGHPRLEARPRRGAPARVARAAGRRL